VFHLQLERAHCRALIAVLREDALADNARRRLAAIEQRLADAPPGRMAVLTQRHGLDPLAVDFVWTAVALAAEPRLVAHAEALDGPVARRGLTCALYSRLARLDDADGHALALWLARANPLVDAGLLGVADTAYLPAAAPVAAAHRLVTFLAGDDRPDPAVAPLVVPAGELPIDARQQAALDELARALADRRALVIVEGPRGSGRRTAIARACSGHLALAVAAHGDALDPLLRALGRELALGDALAVLVDLVPSSDPATVAPLRARLEAWLETCRGPVAITTTQWSLDVRTDRPVVRVRWPIADVQVRRRQWARIAEQHGCTAIEGDVDQLAMQYHIGPGGMARATRSAMLGRVAPTSLAATEIVEGIRHNIAERLGGLAHRVEVRQRWDDLVLNEDTLDQVTALIARVRHAYLVLESWRYGTKMARGQGVAALFSGPPGTGKTMVAGLIAAELGLDLYQVDLSQVVSKWIGETEKQLARIFEAAEEGHALLLFDEADALFGQRSTEMKGATDRYANLEVNYLLQRIESFGGLTILTTNLDQSIDKALRRRLASHIVFAPPDDDERERLWQTLTATGGAPLAPELDFVALAHDFPTMTGANIRNAAIAAAFLAANDRSTTISFDHLMRAARAEYRSMGHVLAERSLGKRGGG